MKNETWAPSAPNGLALGVIGLCLTVQTTQAT